jgi:ABC-type multidrug transport system fused ATPase/permease subunit
MIIFIASNICRDYFIGQWVKNKDEELFFHFFTYSLLFSFTASLAVSMRAAVFQLFTYRAAKILHSQMINKLMKAPINLYFDVTPIGRILNKFSKDLNAIET